MANRSYLFASDVVPAPGISPNEHRAIGISEWNYDIPIVFKLLLSASPQPCPSLVWPTAGSVALVGDYAEGLARLKAFLGRIERADALPLIEEGLEFLNRETSRRKYLVLECAEIFSMDREDLMQCNTQLAGELLNLEKEVVAALESILPSPVEKRKRAGLLAKLLGRTTAPPPPGADPLQAVYRLGLGNWSNDLYLSFNNA